MTKTTMTAAVLEAPGAPFQVRQILREATKLIEAGKILARVDPRRFTLETAGEAHRAADDGTAVGKLVVET